MNGRFSKSEFDICNDRSDSVTQLNKFGYVTFPDQLTAWVHELNKKCQLFHNYFFTVQL